MVTREDALRLAREWIAAGSAVKNAAGSDVNHIDGDSDVNHIDGDSDVSHIDVDLLEFDLGYVVWRRQPGFTPGQPLPDVGGARAVVDRETGELSVWPMVAPEAIVERYRASQAAKRRFPSQVLDDLRAAGWRPGRDATAALDVWLRDTDIESELPMFAAARRALTEFGGLTVDQRGPTGIPSAQWASTFYPTRLRPTTREIVEFGQLIGAAVFPLGGHAQGPSHLVIDEHNRVFWLNPAEYVVIGETLDEAIQWCVLGGDRPVIDDAGRW